MIKDNNRSNVTKSDLRVGDEVMVFFGGEFRGAEIVGRRGTKVYFQNIVGIFELDDNKDFFFKA